MVEAVAEVPSHLDLYTQIINRPDVREAGSLSEQNSLIFRYYYGQETTVFEATVSAFEASNREAIQELAELRAEKERIRNSRREKRTAALLEIEAKGYTWGMIFNPTKL